MIGCGPEVLTARGGLAPQVRVGAGTVLARTISSGLSRVVSRRDSLFEHPVEVALQGVIASAAAFAWATWRRSGGAARPGGPLAAGIVPVVTFWALARPFPQSLPLFPYTTSVALGGDWAFSLTIWLVVAAVATALLIAGVVTA